MMTEISPVPALLLHTAVFLLLIATALSVAYWAFPEEKAVWKVSVSSVIALAELGICALLLSYAPCKLTSLSLSIAIVGISLPLLALLRASFIEAIREVQRAISSTHSDADGQGRPIWFVMGFGLIFALLLPFALRGHSESYSEFYMVGAATNTPPWASGKITQLRVRVVSHEGATESFAVRTSAEHGKPVIYKLGSIAECDTKTVLLTVPTAPHRMLYRIDLLRDSNPTAYRQLFLWLPATVRHQAPARIALAKNAMFSPRRSVER